MYVGSSIWKYENFRLKGKYDVTNANYPASPIAAIVDQAGKIYLFKVCTLILVNNLHVEK